MASEEELVLAAIAAMSAASESGLTAHATNPFREYPLHVIPPSGGACRGILYTTKIEWLATLTDGMNDIPGDLALVWRFGPLDAGHSRILASVVDGLDAPVLFVGDLDPLDLATYATLVRSDAFSRKGVTHLGISDSWVEACERDLETHSARSLDRFCIRMDEDETEAWERLKTAWPESRTVAGPMACSLLDEGLKLELEGASNPKIYSTSFVRDLVHHLWQYQSPPAYE